ncbi:MAG TPA: hypothetical protein VHJ82_06395 [Actinomycetota bacterium]|nr:hypothetical protein [Actinomycetota bacterium]
MKSGLRTFLAGAVVGSMFAAAPAVAQAVARYARNSDKVDGFHAVAHNESRAARAGRLVATNSEGRFPKALLGKAPDADRVDGISSEALVSDCSEGALRGHATVPADIGSSFERVPGFGTSFGGPVDPSGTNCHLLPAEARHVATGVYEVDLGFVAWDCSSAVPDEILSALVTPMGSGAAPRIATYRPLCGPSGIHVEVRIVDLQGQPRDSSFVIAFIDEAGIPIP